MSNIWSKTRTILHFFFFFMSFILLAAPLATPQMINNFTISASPPSLSIAQGNQDTSTITTTITGQFNSSISLSDSGLPSGVTVGFNPSTIPAPGAGNSTMTITVSSTTSLGTYPITVTGNGGGIQHNVTVTLTVIAGPNFTISASPQSPSIAPGDQGTSTITTTISGGFNSDISLSASGVPTDTTVTFNPPTIPAPGSGNSMMTIIVGSGTPTGTYPITVTGSGEGIQQYVIVTLTVTSSPTFTISASPSSLTIAQGSHGTSTITTTVSGGFNSSISLAASGLPLGVGVSFRPNPIPAPGFGNSAMTISVLRFARVGTYPITVTGNGGGVQQETTVTLTVTVPGNFTISASPSSLTIAQGNQGTSTITTTISGGFNSPISLSASAVPSQTTVDFNPNPIPAPGSGNSTMTITVGTSTPTGTYPITVTGNGGGIQHNATVILTVVALEITSTSLLPATIDTAYSSTVHVTGGVGTITYSISVGSLPTGLNLNASLGVISGTPSVVSFSSFTVHAADSSGPTSDRTFFIAVFPVLDTYGGVTAIPGCTQTGFFKLTTFNQHWVFADPLCNAYRGMGVSNVGDGNINTYEPQLLSARYGSAPDDAWRTHTMQRMQSWGFNMLGAYGDCHLFGCYGGTSPTPRFPWVQMAGGSGWDYHYYGGTHPLKDILAGVKTSVYHGYRNNMSDYFDAEWPVAAAYVANYRNAAQGGHIATDPWLVYWVTEDADYNWAFKQRGDSGDPYGDHTYPHMGFLIAVTAFNQTYLGQTVDPIMHTKMAWACGGTNPASCDGTSYLEGKYHTIGALNTAWGSNYTTFGTGGLSSGTCGGHPGADGLTAWGCGSGLLDEDGIKGRSWTGTDPYVLSNASAGFKTDAFRGLYNYAYQSVRPMVVGIHAIDSNHLIASTDALLNRGFPAWPDVEQAFADAGIDLFFAHYEPGGTAHPEFLNNISNSIAVYNQIGKPLVLWTGGTANADSWWSSQCNSAGQYLHNGGYPCLGSPGNSDSGLQTTRASEFATLFTRAFAAQAADGTYPVVALEFWGMADDTAGERANWGLITNSDDAYDGNCATIAGGIDAFGIPCGGPQTDQKGGESSNYGNFLGPVSQANLAIMQSVMQWTSPPPPPPPPPTRSPSRHRASPAQQRFRE